MELSLEKPEDIVKLYDERSGFWKFVKVDKGPVRYAKIIQNTFQRLGLSKNEVKVYLYLAKTGEHKASEISEALSLHRTETYRILRDLEKKGLVLSVFEKPLRFIATPFEKALDVLIDTKRMKIDLLEKKKEGLVNLWLSLPHSNVGPQRKEVFQILEGQEQITSRAEKILEKVEKDVLIFISEDDMPNFYHSSVIDRLEESAKEGVRVQLLIKNSRKNCLFLEKMGLRKTEYFISEIDDELPTYLVVDDDELLLLIRKNNNDKTVAALYTNYLAFIQVLKALFAGLWRSES